MRPNQFLVGLCASFVFSSLLLPGWAQVAGQVGKDPDTAQSRAADFEPPTSIFNDQLRRFRFELEDEIVTAETAEEFMVRYQRPDNPRILGAYPDTRSNALFVVGPPEAEQAIRECLAQSIVDVLGLRGAMPLEMQLRILHHERKDKLLIMADLEIQEVGAADEENGPQKAKQFAAKRQIFENELKITEQQIRVVRKYMARLAEEEASPGEGANGP
jgi:hypothetical protein